MKRALQSTTWVLLACFALLGSSCQNVNPIAAAETDEQRAYATYGMYVIFIEKAADLVENPNTPRDVKLALIHAEETASPIADMLLTIALDVTAIREELAKSGTGEERLATALIHLNGWVNQLIPHLNNLVTQVKGASV